LVKVVKSRYRLYTLNNSVSHYQHHFTEAVSFTQGNYQVELAWRKLDDGILNPDDPRWLTA
jgi:hypothetical protein